MKPILHPDIIGGAVSNMPQTILRSLVAYHFLDKSPTKDRRWLQSLFLHLNIVGEGQNL